MGKREVTTRPSANLDLVRSVFAHWEHGDFDSTYAFAHPDIEFVIADGPQPGRWTGVAEAKEAFGEEVLSAFQETHAEADEYRELDHERVLVLVHRSGRGRTSGVEIGEMRGRGANLFHIRDGKVTRLVLYWDRERALADLGLAPEGGSQP